MSKQAGGWRNPATVAWRLSLVLVIALVVGGVLVVSAEQSPWRGNARLAEEPVSPEPSDGWAADLQFEAYQSEINGCMQDIAGFDLNCTADDIAVADTNVTILDGCDAPGDTATVLLEAFVESNATTRYDVGVYMALDGGDALTGSCSVSVLPTTPSPPYVNLDQDFCGDITSAAAIAHPIGEMTLQCIDTDGDGFLNVPTCTTWRQNTADVCNGPLEAYPGTPSKCACQSVNIEVPVPKVLEVRKVTVPSDDGGAFTLQIDGGATAEAANVSNGGTTGKVDVEVGTHSVGETAGDGNSLDNYDTVIECIDGGGSGSQVAYGEFSTGDPRELNVEVPAAETDIVCTVTNTRISLDVDVTKYVSADGASWADANTGPGLEIATGGAVYWKIDLANYSNVPVDLTWSDTRYGSLIDLGVYCADLPTSLAVGGSYSCEFLDPAPALAGEQLNTVMVDATYNAVSTSDSDPAHYYGVSMDIDVIKYVSSDGVNWADANSAPGLEIATGADVYWKVELANNSNVPVDLAWKDERYGSEIDLTTYCADLPVNLAAGGSYDCEFPDPAAALAGQRMNIVYVDADHNGFTDWDMDPAYYYGVSLAIDVTKYVSSDGLTWADANTAPGLEIETGAAVYWKIEVANDSNVPVDLTWNDVRYGVGVDLTQFCANLPDSLAAGGSYSCDFLDPEGAREGEQLNTVTVDAHHNGFTDSDSDPAYYYGVSMDVDVTKYVSADGQAWEDANTAPGLEIETGADVHWKVEVANNSNVPVALTWNDVRYGVGVDLTLFCTDLPDSLAAGGSYSCDFLDPEGAREGEQLNTVYVDAEHNGFTDSDEDPAYYYGVSMDIDVTKYVSADGQAWEDANTAPGLEIETGADVYWKVEVANNSNVPVDLTWNDVRYGVGVDLTQFCANLPDSLAAGGSYSCQFLDPEPAYEGEQLNTVYVDADHNGFTDSDEDPAYYYGVSMDIDVIKYVSADGLAWEDANAAPGLEIETGGDVHWKVELANNSNVAVDLDWSDIRYGAPVDLTAFCADLPDSLAAGGSYSCDFLDPAPALAGEQLNTVYVGAEHNGFTDSDEDPAYYYGVSMDIDVTKYVSADGQAWEDANTAPGLEIETGADVHWKVEVANNSNVPVALTWNDVRYGAPVDLTLFCLDLPDNLDAGSSYSCEFMDPAAAYEGEQLNTVTVDAGHNGFTDSDSDPAYYYGVSMDVDVTKYVSIDGVSWEDANSPAEAMVALAGGDIYWKIEVANNSNVAVDLDWSDVRYGSPVELTLFCADLPASLPDGGFYSCEFLDPEPAYPGEQVNIVTVDAAHNGFTDWDEDPAYYFGVKIELDKQIRAYEDGAWKDHVTVIVGTPLYYRFVVDNPTPYDLQDVQVTDPTLGQYLFADPGHVFCDIGLLLGGESVTCPAVPLGPIPAEFTGMGSMYEPAFENTAYVEGCAVSNPGVCTSDDDTASYTGLYWAFTPGFWKNHAYDSSSGKDAWLFTDYGSETGDYANVCDVFVNAGDFVRCENLLNTLRRMRGGSGDDGAAQILLRAGIAALLNASFHEVQHGGITGPNGEILYPWDSASVMAKVDEALGWPSAGQDDPEDGVYKSAREKMLELATMLDSWNNGIHYINWDDPAEYPTP